MGEGECGDLETRGSGCKPIRMRTTRSGVSMTGYHDPSLSGRRNLPSATNLPHILKILSMKCTASSPDLPGLSAPIPFNLFNEAARGSTYGTP